MNVVIIIQARMGATRLPGKPMLKVLGRPLIEYLIDRLICVKFATKIAVATTTNPRDQEIVNFCQFKGVQVFKGSEEDVLSRFVQAAQFFHADVIVRVTADCPLMDPSVVDEAILFYLEHFPDYDYVSNTLKRTYPRGMDVEVFSIKSLEEADGHAKTREEREHVTPYIYRHPKLYRLGSIEREIDESQHRWTVDTALDLELVTKIIETLYPTNPDFTMQDILDLLNNHPNWVKINADVQQKTLEEG